MSHCPPDHASLTSPMRLAWHLRDDIQLELRLAGLTQETDFLLWWLTSAWKEFPAAFGPPRPEDVAVANSVIAPGAGTDMPPLTRLMDFVWRFRRRDTAAFDRQHLDGQAAFTAWFYANAVPEMELFPLLDGRQRTWLFDPVTPPLTPVGLSLPRIARLTWFTRPDVRSTFDPDTPTGALALLAWYVRYGASEMHHDGVLTWQPPLSLDADIPDFPGLTRRGYLLWLTDEKARNTLDPVRTDHRAVIMARSQEQTTLTPRRPDEPRVLHYGPPAPPRYTFGVNVIGYARGELGIGEDSRMCALSLATAGIPFSVVNVPTGPGTRQSDAWLDAFIAEDLPYPVNIFCLTGLDTARLWLERGEALFGGRINIGYWPWELPGWPEVMNDAFSLVDELWLSTVYARDAFATTATVPIKLMPMAVTIDRLTPVPRSRFRLPEDRFVFLYVFDANSYLARKNPIATVTAFRKAFPKGDEPVCLVLKTMNPRNDDFRWRTLVAAAAADRRIEIITETLDRGEVLGLFATCDAYLSPHRSEGFGRTLAEAMLLGKPVIATAYSGNADFLTPQTGFPISYRLVPVSSREYPFGEGMLWGEPDSEALVKAMRLVVAQPGLAYRRGLAGRDYIAQRYDPKVVGATYLERLQSLIGAPTAKTRTSLFID